MKVNSKRKFEMNYSFLKPLSQNYENLTPCGAVINPKMGQKIKIDILCTNIDRMMKVKSKRYFEVNFLFMKPFSQNFEDWTQRGNVIN